MKHDDFRLKRPEIPSLVESDFDPSGGDLDAQSAWKNLGGKSLVEAYEIFQTNPLRFQEDYMWMGARAFDYYFPVVDEHLRAVSEDDEGDDREAMILGSCIAAQFQLNGESPALETQREIAELAKFVLSSLARFTPREKEQRGIERSWKAVQSKLEGKRGTK